MFFELFTILLACSSANAFVIFEDCGSEYELEAVDISGCGWSLPCPLTLGENVPVTLYFVADFTSSSLNQDVTINLNHVNRPTPVTPEPCETVACPLPTASGSVTAFTSIMIVPEDIALNQRGYLRWRVHNERGSVVLCYQVLIQTQNYFQKFLRQTLKKDTTDNEISVSLNDFLRSKKQRYNAEINTAHLQINKNSSTVSPTRSDYLNEQIARK